MGLLWSAHQLTIFSLLNYCASACNSQWQYNCAPNTVSMMQSTQKKAHCIMRFYDVKFVVTTHLLPTYKREPPDTITRKTMDFRRESCICKCTVYRVWRIRHLRLSQQCFGGLRSSGMWSCVTRWVVPDILRECCTNIFKAKQSEKNSQCAIFTGWLDPQKLRPYTHPKCWKPFIQWHSVTSTDMNLNKSVTFQTLQPGISRPMIQTVLLKGLRLHT